MGLRIVNMRDRNRNGKNVQANGLFILFHGVFHVAFLSRDMGGERNFGTF